MIGIVGGLGPYSGTDLLNKIFDNTLAKTDQEHLDAILLSMPAHVEDRTAYLMGDVAVNPAFAIAKLFLKLEKIGVTVGGIPCNTAHSEKIFQVMQQELQKTKSRINVLNMIDETISFIATNYPIIKNVGVLSTTGAYKSKLYTAPLIAQGYKVSVPSWQMQETLIHPAIYHQTYGLKSMSNPVHKTARNNLLSGIQYLKEQGAQVVVLGCTEMPLAITEPEINDLIMVDPTNILARALIRHSSPHKLKPL